jgi:hypothetical protein
MSTIKEWRDNEEAFIRHLKIAPLLSIKPVTMQCPECGSKDYDPVHGCFTAHGKFREAA